MNIQTRNIAVIWVKGGRQNVWGEKTNGIVQRDRATDRNNGIRREMECDVDRLL